MGKKFNKFLSVILALVISSSSVIAVSADTVEVNEPDVSAEPYTFEWTEETQTKEFEVKSNVLGETDDEAIPKENGNANEKAKEESFSPQRENPENKINQEDTPEPVQAEKVTPENSGAVNTTAAAGDTEIQSGTSGDLTWKYDGDTKTLTISGEGDMGSYSSYGSYAPWKDKDIDFL